MTLIAIVLIVISAAVHAAWNLLSKSKHPTSAFFLITTAGGIVLFLPFLIWHWRMLFLVPGAVWVLVAGTGFFLALYYSALAGAYRSGDMSVAYPLARSMPLVLVPAIGFVLGRGDQITTLCLAGILLIIVGCFILPSKRFTELKPRDYVNATCVLALLAAIGTAGYSVIDDQALRLLRSASLPGMNVLETTVFYAGLETISATLWQVAVVFFRREGRKVFRRELKTSLGHTLLAGFMIWSSYGLILFSLAYVKEVSYAAAFRQLSIPLGAGLGIIVLKEPAHRPKIAGVAIITLGLILVAVG